MEKVYILILNWNNWKDTIACMESISRQSFRNYQIVLVDNDSADGSVEKIADFLNNSSGESARYPYFIFRENQVMSADFLSAPFAGKIKDLYPVIIIRNSRNHGFGKGNNVGLHFIQSLKQNEYVWLLNNDTVVHVDALTELMTEALGCESTGVAGSVLLYYDRPEKIQAIGGGVFYPWLGLSKLTGKNKPLEALPDLKHNSSGPGIPYIMGASMLIPSQVLRNVGFFDEDYFLYSEELDLCHRIKKAGYHLTCSAKSFVFHKESASVRDKRHFYFYYLTKGNMIFLKKHFPAFFQICSLLPILFSTIRITRDVKNLKYVLKGYLEGLQFKNGVSKS